MFEKISPDKQLDMSDRKEAKLHLKEMKQDPLNIGSKITPSNILVNERGFEIIEKEKIFDKVETPTLVLKGGKDKVVCNNKIDEFFKQIPVEQK